MVYLREYGCLSFGAMDIFLKIDGVLKRTLLPILVGAMVINVDGERKEVLMENICPFKLAPWLFKKKVDNVFKIKHLPTVLSAMIIKVDGQRKELLIENIHPFYLAPWLF